MFNLCDIHFHTNMSYDAYENIGSVVFDISSICDHLMCNERDEEKNVKLVCATDHNIFDYNYYLFMKSEFESKGVVLLPGIEINGDASVHWIFIFDDIALAQEEQVQGTSLGQKLTDMINKLFNYNITDPLVPQAEKVQPHTQNVISFVEQLIDLKIEFLAIPHMDKTKGWYDILKTSPEQMQRINYLLCDGIINGFESKKMQSAILNKIKQTEEYINKHADLITNLEKSKSETEDEITKQQLQQQIDDLLKQLIREKTYVDIPEKLQGILESNETASVYGSDYHGRKTDVYKKEDLFYMTSEPTFYGLKFSLLDWYSRIFSFERKQKHSKRENYIISSVDLLVNGKRQRVNFGEALNSIIGSRGTGKSYLLSCLLGNTKEYNKAEINNQIKLESIHFKNHSSSLVLDPLQYDYISQKNGIGKDEKNIYDLLAKAPYNFEEFKSGIQRFYNPSKEKTENINDFFKDANILLLFYSKIHQMENQKIDLKFLDTYNEFYNNITDEIQLSSLFQNLKLKLEGSLKSENEQISNLQEFIASLDKLILGYEKIKEYKFVKDAVKENLLVKEDFKDLKELKTSLETNALPKIHSLKRTNEAINSSIININKRISKNADNVKNILDDSINKLQNLIHQYVFLLNNATTKRKEVNQKMKEALIDREYYSFDSETNTYGLTISEELKWNTLTDKQLLEIFRNYNTIKDLDVLKLMKIFSEDDFGDFYCDIFLTNIDRRSNNLNLVRPTINSNIYFNDNGKLINWKTQSPGQRSDLLLGCILTSNSSKILIIDQPEDDLDNETIFNKIVTLIRDIKLNRQVIIVTHNANLAITADSDIIVICENDNNTYGILADTMESRKKYTYHSINQNALEDTIINLACNILEGGKKAIRRRIKKIGIRELLYEEVNI